MPREEFEKLIEEGFSRIPEKFRAKLKNVAFLAEDEPSREVREREGLRDDETLLGMYAGVPVSMRGDSYGVGMTLPDTITIYQRPIEKEAEGDPARLSEIVYDTVWHEVAHYLGLNEDEVRGREEERGIR
jgi:predicted Zn-dependent protease with MMP-like domain